MTQRVFSAIVYGAIAIAVALVVRDCSSRGPKSRADAAERRADSIAAILDTSRQLSGAQLASVRKLYGDSVRAAERRVLQVAPKRDNVDKELDRLTTANAVLTAKVRELTATALGAVTADSATGDRTADFHIRQEPYTVDASVRLPPTGSGRLNVKVAIDTARIVIRNQCGRDGVFKPATLLVVSPDWLPIRVDSAQSDPAHCNPPRARKWYDGRLTFGPSVNLNLVRDTTARGGWRPNVSYGISGQLSLWRWP